MKEVIDISMVTCNRLHLLKETIEALETRLKTPYRLIVVDNGSSDGTIEWLKELSKVSKYQVDTIFNEIPVDLAHTSTQGLEMATSRLFVTTMDDILIPDLDGDDVLARLIEMIDRRQDLGAICLRTAIMQRKFPEEEVLIVKKACPAYFRIQRTEEIKSLGGFGHGRWEDSIMATQLCPKLGKEAAITSDLWAKDLGAAPDRGYPEWYREQLRKDGGKYAWGGSDRPIYIDPATPLDPKTNKIIK